MSNLKLRPAFATRAFALAAAFGAVLAAGAPQAIADPVADFYKGKQISLIIGYGPGGGYDTYARFVARYLGDRIPGNPAMVPRNMPGAGSLTAANHLYNLAPKDGTAIGAVSQNLALMQVLGQEGIQFDAPKFNWIGRITDADAVVGAWHTSPAKTIEDVKTHKIPVAVGSGLSGSVLYISFMNQLAGMKFDPIAGYSSGLALLALERGEVDASSSLLWSALKAKKPDWIRDNKVNILVQITLQKIPDLPNVPRMVDLATNEEDRKMMTALTATNVLGRSIVAPPELPADRLSALQKAFQELMTNEKFLEEAKKARLDINPLSGQEVADLIKDASQLSDNLIARMREMANIKYREVEKKKKK